MASEGLKDWTNQGFTNISRSRGSTNISSFSGSTNISSSRGSTIIFDLSNSFLQLCLAIYGEKIYFALYKHFKIVREHKKSEKKAENITSFVCLAKSNCCCCCSQHIAHIQYHQTQSFPKNHILLFFYDNSVDAIIWNF